MFIVARWNDILCSWMTCLGKEYFIFFFLYFSSLSIYLEQNVDRSFSDICATLNPSIKPGKLIHLANKHLLG